METLTWLSLIPPILVVFLAVWTKNILFSLFMGVISGLVIYGIFATPQALAARDPLSLMLHGLNVMVSAVGTGENLLLIMFLALLGGIIAILTAVGCANSFSASAAKIIKGKHGAEACTFLMGCIIFIDDYFNAITVGNVMVAITDKFKVSRAKLAYIIDSTSAPVTILLPVSSWVATVISLIIPELESHNMGQPGMQAFLNSTAYNFYAWFTLLMVVVVIVFDMDIGPMKKYEQALAETGKDESIHIDVNESVVDNMGVKQSGTALDLIVVLSSLVVITILMMLYTGGFFSGIATLQQAMIQCDPSRALACASLLTLAICFVLFVARGKMSFVRFNDAFVQGTKSMVSAIIILVLSWVFAAMLGDDGIMTGSYIAGIVNGRLPGWALPVAVFAISALISFSTGASWGAMGIMLPTSITICASIAPQLIYIVLGATLAGSVFGDHCSPLADTTVLSSSGAGCKHLIHVYTQLPYALITAGVCIGAFIVTGVSGKVWPGLLLGGTVIPTLGLIFGKKKSKAGNQRFSQEVCNVQDRNMR